MEWRTIRDQEMMEAPVLKAEIRAGATGRFDVIYDMEVLSVIPLSIRASARRHHSSSFLCLERRDACQRFRGTKGPTTSESRMGRNRLSRESGKGDSSLELRVLLDRCLSDSAPTQANL